MRFLVTTLAVVGILSGSQSAEGAFVAFDFNAGGNTFSSGYDSFQNALIQGPTTLTIGATGVNGQGGVVRFYSPVEDWSGYLDSSFVVKLKRIGNDANLSDIRINFLAIDAATGHLCQYNYVVLAATTNTNTFVTATTTTLRFPDHILDATSGFSNVGTLSPPNLSSLYRFDIQGSYRADQVFRYEFDNLSLLPDPVSATPLPATALIFALGAGLAVARSRRRSGRSSPA